MNGDRHVTVIVPAYQEAESLPPLLERLAAVRGDDTVIEALDVIVVNDESGDGTQAAVDALGLDWVHVITRTEERGLSSAVLHGLAAAQGDILIVMDADLSHPPEAIPAFVKALQRGADFALGSRYVPGGSTEDGWGVLRWVNSKIATWMARPFTSVKDPMSGFIGIRRDTWSQAVDLDPVGYKIGLELIVKCRCTHVVEVPIHFSTRQLGHSKLTLRVQLEYLQHVIRLLRWKFPGWSSFLPFAAVGASGMGIYVGLLAVLGACVPDWSTLAQTIVAALGAMLWNFVLDRWLAFWYATRGNIVKQALGFMAICSVPVLVNILITVSLAGDAWGTPLAGVVGSLVGSAAGVLFNWLMTRWLVFGRSKHVT